MNKYYTKLTSIFNCINSDCRKIDLEEFLQWCIDYNCYSIALQNWIVISDLIEYHNKNLFYLNDKKGFKNE